MLMALTDTSKYNNSVSPTFDFVRSEDDDTLK